MTGDLVSAASLMVMFVVMCVLFKMSFAVINMQPRVDQHHDGHRTTKRRRRKRQIAERIGNRPRAQEHDDRHC